MPLRRARWKSAVARNRLSVARLRTVAADGRPISFDDASRGDEDTKVDATSARAATTAPKSGVETHYVEGWEFRCAFAQRRRESFAPLAGEGRTANGCP